MRKNKKKRILSLILSIIMIMNTAAAIPANINADLLATGEAEALKQTARHKEAFEYALFAGNEATTLEMNAGKINITGDVHSNSNFIYRGSEIILNGVCEAVNDITISVSDTDYLDKITALQEDTEQVIIPDYTEEIYTHLMENDVPEYYDWTSFSDKYVNIENGMYVDGTLGVYSSQFKGSGIIYAKNSINYSVGEISNADNGMMVLCAANGDINIYASNTTINGVIYAPNGTVTITGQNVIINGRIITNKFNFWGSNLTINKGEGDLDLLDFLFVPIPDIKAEGEFKENRKVTLDVSQTEKIEKVIKEETEWFITKIDGDERIEAVEGVHYAFEDSTSDEYTKNMIFKEFGTYEVAVTFKSASSEKTGTLQFEIIEDLCPIVDFTIDNDYYYREPENDSKATIILKDFSYSVDNDAIGQRIWTVYYDSNNNGEFEEEEATVISDGNESEVAYETKNVGNFKVELASVETFDNTIPELLSDDAYKSANTADKDIESKTFEIGNIAPESNVDVGIAKDVDLVFTVGSSDVETVNVYAERIEQIKQELESQGYTVHLSTVETLCLAAKDTFAWTEYDHYNYIDTYVPTLAKHIIYDGDNIKMLGYGWAPIRDFLFIEDNSSLQRIFTFDVQKDKTDWHSMEGGGFLFNATIRYGRLYGFCILITQSGLKLCQISGANVNKFRDGSTSNIKQLRTFPFSNLYDEHNIKIVADQEKLSLWDGKELVIDNYILPVNDYGYGYGPIVSHVLHGCSQQSYFTFSNIKMYTITGQSLSEVLENYDWQSKTSRYVINLSDSELEEFETDEELALVAKQILENDLSFIGIGNSLNNEQYTDIIRSAAGNGLYLDSADTDSSLDNLTNYIVSSENNKDFSVDYYVAKDQPIRYIESYKDYENDPLYEQEWTYEYDPTPFYNESGNTELSTIVSLEPLTVFEETGAYTMRLKVRDNPVGDNGALDEYRLWSGEKSYEKVLMVHNRPIAELTVDVAENPNDTDTVIINVSDNCYDYDHLDEESKGIVSKEYKWKKLEDSAWTEGPISNKVEIGGIYIICLTATDKEGQASYPNVQIIDTNQYYVPEEIEDNELPTIHLEMEKSKANVGETIKITGYATDNMGVDVFEIYVNGELTVDHAGRCFYTGYKNEVVEVKAVAVDIYGNRAEETQYLTIVDNSDKTAPVVEITSPDNGSFTEFSIQFVGSAYDETLLENYRLEYKRQGTDNYTVIAESDEGVEDGILGEWNVEGLESGVYEVKLSATDGAGNTAYIIYQYELMPSEDGGIVDTEEVDHDAPIIILTSSADVVNVGEEFKIKIDATDASKITEVFVYVDDEVLMTSTGEITMSEAESKVVNVKVYAADEWGNTAVKELSVIVVDDTDKVAPVANIKTPEHASTISGSVDIIGTAYDETEMLRYRLEYKNQSEESYTTIVEMFNQIEDNILGTFNTSVLENGVYDVRLTVWDKSGNYASVQNSYIVDNDEESDVEEEADVIKPVIDIMMSTEEAEVGEEVTCVVSVTDNKAIEAVKVYVDGEVILNGNGSFKFSRAQASVVKIEVYAVDAAGNMARETRECIIVDNTDKNVPQAMIISPAHASEIYGTVDIEGTATDAEGLLKYTLAYRLQGSEDFTVFCEGTESTEEGVLGKFNTQYLLNGVYEVRLTVWDKGGNASYIQYSYVVNNENEGSGVVPEDEEKDIIDPTINLVISKNVASLNEVVKAYIKVTDNKEVADLTVYINDKEVELTGTQVEFTSDICGKVTVKVVATDASGNTSVKEAECSFYNLTDTVAPIIDITSPDFGESVDKPVEIIGSIYDETELDYYKIEYRMAGADKYTVLAESSEAKNNEAVAVLDTTVLANGIYEFKITAVDFGGNIKYSQFNYIVEGQLKIGNMNLSFADISTTISGIPINVTRYYSSANKLSGDFGTGWTLGLGGMSVSEMNPMYSGWSLDVYGQYLGTYYALTENVSHDVVINMGDGTSERFKVKLGTETQKWVPIQQTTIEFESQSDSKNKLEVYGSNLAYVTNIGGWTFTGEDGELFEIEKYKLTMEDGTVVIIDKENGVESITDKAGNVVSVSKDGYVDENGEGLTFKRDTNGRIESITEADGKVTTYTYDNDDNLIKVTNPMGYSVCFTYDDNHNLLSMIDSRGVEVARNEYDESGRIVATVDADGNRMTYEHDVDGKTEIITDKLGHKTVYVYDDRGNVLKCTDANGNTVYSSYDENGQLCETIDALGNVTAYEISATGDVISMTNAVGNVVENSYDEKDRITSITAMGVTQLLINYDDEGLITSTEDALGNGIYYEYDSSYRVTGVTDEIGTFMTMTYDANGNVTSTVNGEGETATFTYDESGNCISKTVVRNTEEGSETITESYQYDGLDRLVKVIYADGTVTSVEYDGNGNMTAAVDEKGRRTTYEYDNNGNLTKITYCDNTTETFEYDAEGRNTKATDRMGRSITMTYDNVGNMLTKTYSNGTTISYTYDAKYRVTSITDINGGVTSYEYDAIDRNTAIVDTYGNRTEFAYNESSMLSSMTDAKGNVFQFVYDANGNRTETIMPDGTTIKSEYDARGRITSQTDQNGYVTTYEYDKADRLIAVTDALGSKWEYTYNGVGELTAVQDANGNVTSYEYDSLGRVISVTNAAGKTATCTYDESGNILTSTDYAGITTTYTYDGLDRVIAKDVDGELTEYTYTVNGLLSSVTDKSGVIKYTYDDMDGLVSVVLTDGTEIGYEYDSSLRLTKVSTPYGDTSYEYDLMDRITRVVDRNGVATLYEYDANGNRTAVTYGNGIVVQYVYNEVNQLISEKIVDKDSNVIEEYIYTLGKAGERLKVTESDLETEYTYDELYRLTGEKVTKADGIVTETTYTYDKVGNRLTKTADGVVTEYNYNELNQLVSETGVTYSYDDNGNLIKKEEADKTTTYTFDKENHLIRATISAGQDVTIEEYEYDYAGNRTAKITEDKTVRYVVDTNGYLSQVLYETDGDGNLTTFYTRGAELLTLERTDELRYYLYDGHGNVRHLTDENGTVTDTYDYDAFGNITEQTGDTENSYLYCGEQYDANTGFYYLRARYMNPGTGIFISMDSYQGSLFDPVSLHKYLYANANPVMYTDPTGYFSLSELKITQTMQGVLNSVTTPNFLAIMNKLNTMATIYDTVVMIKNVLQDAEGSALEVAWALGSGLISSLFINKMCSIKNIGPVVSKIVIGFGLATELENIFYNAKEGNWDLVATGVIHLLTSVLSLGQSCFTGDTLVATEDGQVRIDEIELGDKVWAHNVETGETELKEVTHIYVHEVDEILHLYTSEGQIDTTTNHPFYVVDKGWVAAGDLKAGDEVYQLDGTTTVVVGSELEKFDEAIKVYNLEIEDFHSYFVGEEPVLVHNYESESENTKHGDQRLRERGFSDEKVSDIMNNYSQKVYQEGGRTVFAKKNGNYYDVIITNSNGEIITAVGGNTKSLKTWSAVEKMLGNNGGYSYLPY